MLNDPDRGPLLETFLVKLAQERRSREETTGIGRTLRVVAISTEVGSEKALKSLNEALTHLDGMTGEVVAPINIISSERPVPVTHQLVLPGEPHRVGSFRTIPIAKFEKDAPRQLSADYIESLRRQIGFGIQQHSGSVKWRPKVNETNERIQAFIESLLRENTSRRVLFFVSSKDRIGELAAYAKNRVARRGRDHPFEHLRQRFESLTHEVEDPEELRTLGEWASCGVFAHHSSLSSKLRHLAAEICRGEITNPPQILFATETLTFGVNLAITDVALLGTQFYSAAPNRERLGQTVPLTQCEYHNMAGRAGRLGKMNLGAEANVFVFPWQDQEPMATVVNQYYSTVQPLQSQIFLREDRALVRNTTTEPLKAESFTHNFIRIVLDPLRHLRTTGKIPTSVRAGDIVDFYKQSLFGRISGPLTGSERAQVGELFQTAITRALDACASKNLLLVEQDADGGYMITPEGEAIIDTGVEVRTIIPLLELVDRLRDLWQSSAFSTRQFPPELYLLAILSQHEALTGAARDLPEWSIDRREWNANARLRNKTALLEHLGAALRKIVGPVTDESAHTQCKELARNIRDMLIKHKTVLEIWNLPNNRGTGYEDGAADLIIRLFSAIVGWVHGESLQAVRRQLEEVRGLQLRSKFSADFAVYAERLSWKVDCLIRLLSARADRSSQRTMDAGVDPSGDLDVTITFPSEAHFSEELGLRLLVQRLRLGCHTAAIPILWKRSANVRRADATEYLSRGWSPIDILRDFEFSKFNGGDWSAPGTLTSIHQVVSDYVLKQFHTLATEFMMRGGEGQSHQDPGLVLWQWLDEKSGIESFMEQYHLGNPNRDFADYAWDRFQPSIEVDRERAVGDGTSSDALLLATDQTDEASYSLALHHGTNGALVLREHVVTLSDTRRQQSQRTRLTKFLFVGTTSDWKTADKSFDQILQAEEGTDRLIVVFVPWMPPATSCPPAITAEFDKRFSNPNYITACMTLSAFAVLISALGRRFMPPEHLLATLFSKNNEGTIGLSNLYRAMAPFSGFPVPLKEALLRCSDVEVASNLPRSQTAKGHASEAGAVEQIVAAGPDGVAALEASE